MSKHSNLSTVLDLMDKCNNSRAEHPLLEPASMQLRLLVADVAELAGRLILANRDVDVLKDALRKIAADRDALKCITKAQGKQ